MSNKLEVIQASFLGTLVRDHTTHQAYFYDGRWLEFIDFGKPGKPVPAELAVKLYKAIKDYKI